jgi:hypothetical protein
VCRQVLLGELDRSVLVQSPARPAIPFDNADKVLGANVISGIDVDKVELVHDELIDDSDSFYTYPF